MTTPHTDAAPLGVERTSPDVAAIEARAAAATPGDDLSRALCLARIALAFGRVERATLHEDGARPETDTDHTVMLGLVACELAPAHLDRAKVAAFALVHDLAEVYAGDTQTLVISAEGMAAKRDREDAARARLVAELGAGSWVAETLATYEQQREPEARFVRAVDKVLPKLTHAFNGCAAARALTDRAGFIDAHVRQYEKLRVEYPELPEVLALLRASMTHSEACWSASEVRPPSADDELRSLRAHVASEPERVAAAVARDDGAQWRPVDEDTAFAPPFGTIRACRWCGCLVAGGPTACARCADSPTGGV